MGWKHILAMTAGLVLPWSGTEASDGKAIFENTCATCHFTQRDPARRDEMVAPPIDMMAAHVRQLTANDRDVFIARVIDYVKSPAAEKSADPMAIERFGLMPAIGDTFPDLTEADLRDVAGWMFDAHASIRMPAQPGMGMGPRKNR